MNSCVLEGFRRAGCGRSGSEMGRLNSFRIQLDNPSGVYFGGNVVTGTVSLSLGGDGKKARGNI